jgi:hypothetical protein
MVDINITQLIFIAFFTGLGSGIGMPIGQFVFEKYLKNKLERIHSINGSLKTKVLDKAVDNIKKMDENIKFNR